MLRAMMGKKNKVCIIPTYEFYSGRGQDPSLDVYVNGEIYFSKHAYTSETGVCPPLELKIGDVIRVEGFQYLTVTIDGVDYFMGYDSFETVVDRVYSSMNFYVACTDPY